MNLRQSVFGIAALTIVLFLTSCSGIFNTGTKGNGNVITENRKVDSFSEIEIDGVFNVILNQGAKEAVSIESDENLIDLIEVSILDGILIVDLKKNASIGNYTKLNVFITLVDITKMSMDGVGDVSVENGLDLNNFELNNSGVGDINLVINCNELTVDNSSVGDITLSGKTNNFSLNNSGVGDVLAFDLISNTTTVYNSGVGDVEVNAKESIDVESSGVGDVTYSGNPKSKNINDNAVGDVVSK